MRSKFSAVVITQFVPLANEFHEEKASTLLKLRKCFLFAYLFILSIEDSANIFVVVYVHQCDYSENPRNVLERITGHLLNNCPKQPFPVEEENQLKATWPWFCSCPPPQSRPRNCALNHKQFFQQSKRKGKIKGKSNFALAALRKKLKKNETNKRAEIRWRADACSALTTWKKGREASLPLEDRKHN